MVRLSGSQFVRRSERQHSVEILHGYAQKLANFFCDWPSEDWLGSDLEWETMKGRAPTPPPGLSSSKGKLIRRATAFGAVAGRPETHPGCVQWCRDRLLSLRRAAEHYGIVELLEVCFEIGYRTAASSRSPAVSLARERVGSSS
jgi:hypothetical protein